MPDCKRVNDFSISFDSRSSDSVRSQKSLWIVSPKSFGPFFIRTFVKSSSDSEAWSTGICETAAACLQKHKTWYRWIIRGAVWWPSIMILYFSILWSFVLWLPSMEWIDLTHLESSNLLKLILLLPCILLFAALLYIRSWLFSYGVVLIKQKSYKARSILTILTFISTIISALVNIIHKIIDMLN